MLRRICPTFLRKDLWAEITGKEITVSRYGMDTGLVQGEKVRISWNPEHAVVVDLAQEA